MITEALSFLELFWNWIGSWGGFVRELVGVFSQVSDIELVWLFLLVGWLAYVFLLTFAQMYSILWAPSRSTLITWRLYRWLLFPASFCVWGTYLFMSIFGGWVSFDLFRQIILGG